MAHENSRSAPATAELVERAAFRALALTQLLWQQLLNDDDTVTIGGIRSAALADVAESIHRELSFVTNQGGD